MKPSAELLKGALEPIILEVIAEGATSKGLDVARGIACPALVRAVRECDVRARPRRRDRDATSDPARRARYEHAHSSQ